MTMKHSICYLNIGNSCSTSKGGKKRVRSGSYTVNGQREKSWSLYRCMSASRSYLKICTRTGSGTKG
jgi:hypothetical protein